MPQEVSAAVEAIEKYLEAYPEAKDTVDGAQFWCGRFGVVASRHIVQEALTRLVGQGVVRQQAPSRSGRVVYSRLPSAESRSGAGPPDESPVAVSEASDRMYKGRGGVGLVKSRPVVRRKRTA